jgi:hypothetical protein
MRAGRLGAPTLTLLVLVAALAGCGQSSTPHTPALAQLPLVRGSDVVAQATQCDRGAAVYCAVELVVVGPKYGSSDDLLGSERRRLVALGWTRESGDTGNEHAADSPGHKLRVTYATAQGDLTGIVLGWIKRPRPIALALSRTLFRRSAALSMMLEVSSS